MRLTSVWPTAIGLPIAILALPMLVALTDGRVVVYEPPTFAVHDSARAAYERYRALRLRDDVARLRSDKRQASGLMLLEVDSTTADDGAAVAIRKRLAELSQAPAARNPAVPLIVVLHGKAPRDARDTERPVEGVAVPRRAGEPCIVQTSTTGWPVGAASAEAVIEAKRTRVENTAVSTPCLLLATFGRPAPRLAASLDSVQWLPAYGNPWWAPATHTGASHTSNRRPGAASFLGEELEELEFLALFDDCVAAPPRGCGAALLGALSRMRTRHQAPLVTDDAVLLPPAPRNARPLVAPIVDLDGRLLRRSGGRPVRHLMSDIARTLGPERFARMWRTDLPWPDAYAAVAGESFDVFAARWLQVAPPRPLVRAAAMPPADWWWLVAIVATLLGMTLWQVQRRQYA